MPKVKLTPEEILAYADLAQAARRLRRAQEKEKPMSELKVEFAFEIGELVYFRHASHFAGNRPLRFVVISQMAERCSGGVQLFYKLWESTPLVPEIALSREEPPYQPESPESILAILEEGNVLRPFGLTPWQATENKP